MTSKVSANIGYLRESDMGRVISPSLLTLMFSLFECMTEGCGPTIVRPLVEETDDRRIYVFYCGYIMFFVFAVMNLFTFLPIFLLILECSTVSSSKATPLESAAGSGNLSYTSS